MIALIFFTLSLLIAILITILIGMVGFSAFIVIHNIQIGGVTTPTKVIFVILYVACIGGISYGAYDQKIMSDLGIFSFILLASYVIVLAFAFIMTYQVDKQKYQMPHVHSAYGLPIYKFDSSQ